MRLSELKGRFGQKMKDMVDDAINKLMLSFVKNELDKSTTYLKPITIGTIHKLKLFFGKGIYSTNYEKYDTVRNISIHIPKEKCLELCPDPNELKTFTKTYHGQYKFIDYEIVLSMNCYIDHKTKCIEFDTRLNYKLKGDLNEALKYCPAPEKKDIYQYKDMHGNIIELRDEIVWIGSPYNLMYSTVKAFDIDTIITDNNYRINVIEENINRHIVVVNNKINWMGMKI